MTEANPAETTPSGGWFGRNDRTRFVLFGLLPLANIAGILLYGLQQSTAGSGGGRHVSARSRFSSVVFVFTNTPPAMSAFSLTTACRLAPVKSAPLHTADVRSAYDRSA